MLEVNNFSSIRISLASPDQIRNGRRARSRSPRPSTTGRSSRRRMVSSTSASSVRPRTGNATAASTSASATRASSATSVASRSPAARSGASGWATSSWPAPSATSGTSRARRAAWASCSTSARATSSAILYFALYIVTHVDEDARKRALAAIEEEAEGRGGKGGERLAELEDELRADLVRKTDELNVDLAAIRADLEVAARHPDRGAGRRGTGHRGAPGRAQDRRSDRDDRLRPDR